MCVHCSRLALTRVLSVLLRSNTETPSGFGELSEAAVFNCQQLQSSS